MGQDLGRNAEGEKQSIDPDPIGFQIGKLDGFEDYVWHTHLKNFDNKCKSYCQFWGPPAKTSDLFEFLSPPPERGHGCHPGFWDFEFSERPDDNERLVCYYALLVIIHDIQIPEKPIFTVNMYNGPWNLRKKWKDRLWESCIGKHWCAIPSLRIEGLRDIRDWITRALNDVKADITSGGNAGETEQNTTSAKEHKHSVNINISGGIQAENLQISDHSSIRKVVQPQKSKGKVKKTLWVIATILGALASFLRISHYLGWLEAIKAIYR